MIRYLILPNIVKQKFLAVLIAMVFSCLCVSSCSIEENTGREGFSLSQVICKQYPIEIARYETLPNWIQEKITKELSLYPNTFIVKAKSGGKKVFVLSNIFSSSSPVDFYTDEGEKWIGDSRLLSDMVIIYWNSL